MNGKVVAEFTCNEIEKIGNVATCSWDRLLGGVHERQKGLITQNACLTEEECIAYGGRYLWYISELKIYDEPKELNKFNKYCGDNPNCDDCVYCAYESHEGITVYEECMSTTTYHKPLIKAPQSWCYVESEEEA